MTAMPGATAGYCHARNRWKERCGRDRGPHHGHRLEDRGGGRGHHRGGRHGRDPRVDEDGDARRGRGRGHRQGHPRRGGPVGLRGRHARRARVSAELAGGRLRLDVPAEHVARFTIDNQAKRNALDRELLDALARVLAEVDARCLLLTGAGSMFSAGYDIGDLPADRAPTEPLAAEAEDVVAHPFEAALAALDAFPFPSVAALNGHAIGGGLELAVACDLRVAAGSAKLGMPPARLGLVYSHTGLRRFIDAIGAPRTRELFFTARNVDAATALDWGLVNRVVEGGELAAAGVELAAAIA